MKFKQVCPKCKTEFLDGINRIKSTNWRDLGLIRSTTIDTETKKVKQKKLFFTHNILKRIDTIQYDYVKRKIFYFDCPICKCKEEINLIDKTYKSEVKKREWL